MRRGLLLVILSLSALVNPMAAERTLDEVESSEIVRLLNNVVLLSEVVNPQRSNLAVRVYRIREAVDCNGHPQEPHCGYDRVYVAVSYFGENPDQKVYLLVPAQKWEFVEWKSLPKPGSSSSAVFIMRKIGFLPRDGGGKDGLDKAEQIVGVEVNMTLGKTEVIGAH